MESHQYQDIIFILLIVVVLQLMVIINMRSQPRPIAIVSDMLHYQNASVFKQQSVERLPQSLTTTSLDFLPRQQYKPFAGVAVTTFLGSPKWYQNRYTMMINQMLTALPEDWAVQVFYNPMNKMASEGVSYLGIQKAMSLGRVILTPLPYIFNKIKKNQLMLTPYIWEQMISENVLLFGGNSVLCANSNQNITWYAQRFDYIGTPWQEFSGQGGGNGLSLRKRSLVLDILYDLHNNTLSSQQKINTKNNKNDIQKENKMIKTLKEDSYIVSKMLTNKNLRIATREDTFHFAMSGKIAIGQPLGAVGTLDGLSDKMRQQYIDYCPEIKIMFPSLHSPACFGAEPNSLECFRYLCRDGGLKCHMKNNTLQFDYVKSTTNKLVTLTVNSRDAV